MPRITPVDVTAEGDEVAPDELLAAAIPIVRKGYEPDVVDGLLDRAATTIARLQRQDAPEPEPELELRRREEADLLHRTLLLAEASADQRVAEAESLASSVVAEARARAGRVIAEAEQAASHLVAAGQTRAELSVGEAVARRQVLLADIEQLERYAAELQARLRSVFDTQAAALDRVLAAASEDRPPLREIDLTDPILARAPYDEPATSWDDGPVPVDVVEDDEAMALLSDGSARTA